jgi:hypothetical protein
VIAFATRTTQRTTAKTVAATTTRRAAAGRGVASAPPRLCSFRHGQRLGAR